jgi:hypothetical protein
MRQNCRRKLAICSLVPTRLSTQRTRACYVSLWYGNVGDRLDRRMSRTPALGLGV